MPRFDYTVRSLGVWTQILFHSFLILMCSSACCFDSESLWPYPWWLQSGDYCSLTISCIIACNIKYKRDLFQCEERTASLSSEACGGSRPVLGGGFSVVWCVRRVAKEGNVEQWGFDIFPYSVLEVTPKTKLNCKWGTSVIFCYCLFLGCSADLGWDIVKHEIFIFKSCLFSYYVFLHGLIVSNSSVHVKI